MKLPVTENGVTLPKAWFGDAIEVEVRQENGHVSIEPVRADARTSPRMEAYSPDDPIWKIGETESELPISDASVNLDNYLYGDVGNS